MKLLPRIIKMNENVETNNAAFFVTSEVRVNEEYHCCFWQCTTPVSTLEHY